MILTATVLIILGVIVALTGVKVFRLVLPVIGLIAGFMGGFSGVQAVFGTGGASQATAVVTGLIVGAILAVLSFLYFEIAVAVLTAMLFAEAMVFLGSALGLQGNGFVLLLMALAGAVISLAIFSSVPVTASLVITVTAFYGTAMVMAGVLLLVGEVSLSQLHDEGILPVVSQTVGDQFIWLVAWVGTALVSANLQTKAAVQNFLDNNYAFQQSSAKRSK